MSSEIRYILFNAGEVARAMVKYWARRKAPLAPGSIVDFQAFQSSGLEVALMVAHDDANLGRSRISLKEDELTAALVLFCIETRIPVSSKAGKRVMAVPEGMILALGLGLESWQLSNFATSRPPIFEQRRIQRPEEAKPDIKTAPTSVDILWRRALEGPLKKAAATEPAKPAGGETK